MTNTIVATFAHKHDADNAVAALKAAGIQPGSDLPENGENGVIIAAIPNASGGAMGGVMPSAFVPAPNVVATDVAIEDIQDDAVREVIVNVSVQDDGEVDKARAILTQHGGTFAGEGKSTIDEVANPAQAPDRIA